MWTPPFNDVRRRGKVSLFKQCQSEFLSISKMLMSFNINRLKAYLNTRSRRINYYYDYTLRFIGGTTKLLFRRVKNDPLSREQGPLKNTKVCTYIGNTPFHVGTSRGLFINGSRRFINVIDKYKYLFRVKHKEYYDVVIDEILKYREVFNGGINTNLSLLKTMSKDNGIKQSAEEIIETLRKAGFYSSNFKVPIISSIDQDDLVDLVKINTEASPGLLTKLLHGRNRKASIDKSIIDAKKLLKLVLRFPVKNWSLWECLSREKDFSPKSDTEHATRLVVSMEEPHMLVNSIFSQKLTHAFANSSNITVFTGKSLDFKNSSKFASLRNKRKICFSSDWTTFDLYVSKSVLLAAFSILRSSLPSTSEYDRYLYYVYKSYQEKYICVPPGYVYKFEKGLPSGHPLTSIIGSICNLIYWNLIMHAVYGDGSTSKFDIVVSGDDSIIFCDYHENLDNIDSIIEKLGIKSDPIACTSVWPEYISDVREMPSFLQKHFDDGIVLFTRKRFIRRLLFPTKKRRLLSEDIGILEDYCDTNALDHDMSDFVEDVLCCYYKEYMSRTFDTISFRRRRLDMTRAFIRTNRDCNVFKYYHDAYISKLRAPVNTYFSPIRDWKQALSWWVQFPLDVIPLYKTLSRLNKYEDFILNFKIFYDDG